MNVAGCRHLPVRSTKVVRTMPMIACDWELDIERGPNWLLVKVGAPLGKPCEMPPLGDTLRSLMEEHFTYRLVLELDQMGVLDDGLIQELLELHQRISANGGVMRLSGLSSLNGKLLQSRGLDGRLPSYRNRLDAVFGSYRPGQPR